VKVASCLSGSSTDMGSKSGQVVLRNVGNFLSLRHVAMLRNTAMNLCHHESLMLCPYKQYDCNMFTKLLLVDIGPLCQC
jgi:hypothetical protein